MAAIFSFKCATCGDVHEGSPSFAYKAPDPYLGQPEAVRKAGYLSSDLCDYEDEDGWHYFIRVCLEVPIHGVEEPFMWGVWVSLSDESFHRYVETYKEPVLTDRYFGWLSNSLPYYPETHALKTEVRPRAGNTRPFIVLEACDHPLAVDFHRGISIARAQEIAQVALHR